MGKSKRNTPKPNSNRAARLAERRAQHETAAVIERPFAGLAAEGDLIALREFVASAVAPLPSSGRALRVATVLPGAVAALVRQEGNESVGYVAMQCQANPIDLAGSLAAAIEWALQAEAGEALTAADPAQAQASFAELFGADTTLDVTVHNDFNWWVPEGVTPDAQLEATISHAAQVIMPSARVRDVHAAWWVDAGAKAHIRIIRPEAEDELMAALARVHAAGGLTLGEGSRFAGSFRVHGVLVPVFDVDRELHVDEWIPGVVAFEQKLLEALSSSAPLTATELRSRDGIRGRQVTLRY